MNSLPKVVVTWFVTLYLLHVLLIPYQSQAKGSFKPNFVPNMVVVKK